MLYIINPESNQIIVNSPEEVEEITGIPAGRIAEMKEGDFLTDGTENGSFPANWEIAAEENTKKYLVEFAFAENFAQVDEWQTIDGLDIVDAENAEEAAKWAACTDGLENALFRVYELVLNEFGKLEKHGESEYFNF